MPRRLRSSSRARRCSASSRTRSASASARRAASSAARAASRSACCKQHGVGFHLSTRCRKSKGCQACAPRVQPPSALQPQLRPAHAALRPARVGGLRARLRQRPARSTGGAQGQEGASPETSCGRTWIRACSASSSRCCTATRAASCAASSACRLASACCRDFSCSSVSSAAFLASSSAGARRVSSNDASS